MKTPSVKSYYSALQAQFRLQSSILTDVLPHSGERGRNNEERFREFLSRVLPRKYSVGSGFVVCSDASVSVSSQTDVVLFDEFQNAPIHRELASHVYPVEIVYGTVEVKGRLERRDLPKICTDIAKIRTLGQYRYYLKYSAVHKSDEQPTKQIVGRSELHSNVPPRAFVFAYEQKGWESLSDFVDDLAEEARRVSTHIHGLAVLDSDWHVSQEAYAEDPPKFEVAEGDALLNFVNGMLHSIGSVEMMQMSIDRYYHESS
ncbi:MAG: hypothetical protein H8K04_18460 [Nitrospira sp.]